VPAFLLNDGEGNEQRNSKKIQRVFSDQSSAKLLLLCALLNNFQQEIVNGYVS
jgi:hypothetical protein